MNKVPEEDVWAYLGEKNVTVFIPLVQIQTFCLLLDFYEASEPKRAGSGTFCSFPRNFLFNYEKHLM